MLSFALALAMEADHGGAALLHADTELLVQWAAFATAVVVGAAAGARGAARRVTTETATGQLAAQLFSEGMDMLRPVASGARDAFMERKIDAAIDKAFPHLLTEKEG